MLRYALVMLLVLFARSALAQEDPMAVQRCVWSCLANNGPATNPAYHECVERICNENQANQSPAQNTDARQQWIVDRTRGGVGYAGVDGQRSGTGLYYFCGGGQSFLRVVGIDGGERGMIIDVDGVQFPMQFLPNSNNQPETSVAYTNPVIQALRSGSRVKVLSYEAGPIVDATLRGSGAALARVISEC